MKKEKKPLFEQVQFADAVAAQAFITDSEKKLARGKIGLIVAALVPVFDIIISIILRDSAGDVAVGLWFVAAIAAYIVGGGLGSALKFVLKLTYYCWVFFPIFPIDFAIALFAFFMVGGVALFLPVVFVLLTQHQLKKNREAAEMIVNVYASTVAEAV